MAERRESNIASTTNTTTAPAITGATPRTSVVWEKVGVKRPETSYPEVFDPTQTDERVKGMSAKELKQLIVELGGELRVQGKKHPGNNSFKVGVESPSGDDFSTPPMQKVIFMTSGAITTSGNYRKYHESKGKKYSHIIDPHTGKSVNNEMISVTVYAKDAMTADAYDNALMLMGVKRAMRFIEAKPDMAAFLIYKSANGSIADTASSRFRRLVK